MRIVGVIGNSPAERAGITVGGVLKGIKRTGDESYTLVENLDGFSAVFAQIDEGLDFSLKIDYDGVEKVFTLEKEEYQA